ncbi:hypothetical protein [Sphingomonas sp. NFR04]|uniref:hypothetical protein n=1 Tax=Sphingomonas sp. NFR04 TaxID=1566283 RepID=UPI0011139D11|nr:hypothetical protein [Sphingomonas sp. NFR04]
MKPARAAGCGLLLATISAPAMASAQASGSAGVTACPSEDMLLWLEVRTDTDLLAETMDAYAGTGGTLLPLGQFARILDLGIVVAADGRHASGTIDPRTRVTVDLDAGTAQVGATKIALGPGACVRKGDIYLAAETMEKLLPVRLRVAADAQLLQVTPTGTLPLVRNRQVAERRAALSQLAPPETTVMARDPYRAFSIPAVEVNAGQRFGSGEVLQSRWLGVRAAGDLAFAGFRGFVGLDSAGATNIQLTLERTSADNRALGMLGGSRVAVGDVATPDAQLGARSVAGRGIFYSSAPLQAYDFSHPLVLEGDVADGEQIEVYVDGTLRAARAASEGGRYRFDNLSLGIGDHQVRILFYGPQGQVREDVRSFQLGSGLLQPGQTAVRFSVVQPERPLLRMEDGPWPRTGDALRVVALIDRGLSRRVTAHAGLTRFRPWYGQERLAGTAGIKAMLAGAALDGVVGLDSRGGRAASLLAGSRIRGVSVRMLHAEYAGGFVDETRDPMSGGVALRRATEAQVDLAAAFPGGQKMPIAFDIRRIEQQDGTHRVEANARAAAMLGISYVNVMVSRQAWGGGLAGAQHLASIETSTPLAAALQLRTGLAYRITGRPGIESAYVSTQVAMPQGDLQFTVSRQGGMPSRLRLDASYRHRFRRFDLSTAAGYDVRTRSWRAALQVTFAFAQTARQGYGFAPTSVGISGRAAIRTFLDTNGDGHWQPGEKPVGGVQVYTPAGTVTTDAQGRVLAEDLGDTLPAQLRIDASQSSELYLAEMPDAIRLVPRRGRTTPLEIPLRAAGEVEVKLQFATADGAQPLTAVTVELVAERGGTAFPARTDNLGTAMFEGIPPGRYQLRLLPAQASQLHLALQASEAVEVPAQGGFLRVRPLLAHRVDDE